MAQFSVTFNAIRDPAGGRTTRTAPEGRQGAAAAPPAHACSRPRPVSACLLTPASWVALTPAGEARLGQCGPRPRPRAPLWRCLGASGLRVSGGCWQELGKEEARPREEEVSVWEEGVRTRV